MFLNVFVNTSANPHSHLIYFQSCSFISYCLLGRVMPNSRLAGLGGYLKWLWSNILRQNSLQVCVFRELIQKYHTCSLVSQLLPLFQLQCPEKKKTHLVNIILIFQIRLQNASTMLPFVSS